MGLSALIRGIATLSVLAVILLVVSMVSESSLRSTRMTESTFVPLVDGKTLEPKDISKVEVSLPEGEIRWHYKRLEGLWRLPEFANVFALNGDVDNLVKMLLQGQMRPVGRLPEDRAHYGLLPQSVLTVTLFQDTDAVVRVQVGGLLPGAAKDERYVLRDNDQTIYLLSSNPSTFFSDEDPPSMLDKHVLPRALPHGFPQRISFSGSRVSDIQELLIKELPVDPKKFEDMPGRSADKKEKSKKKEPTHEFTGVSSGGALKILDDDDTTMYINRVLDIEFDKIVGSISPVQIEYRNFDAPLVEVTFHYKDESTVTLAVSGSLIEGKYPILNKATSQMFIISEEKFEMLVPKLNAKAAQEKRDE